ncbi:MAG: alanine dehydrogenase [Thermodesulfovibrionales bacterium]|jgi:alanine dehydrogenase
MIIGIPREIKKEEYRVSMTPDGVEELKRLGHTVLVESGAGTGSGFPDEDYLRMDADIVDRDRVFLKSDLIIKVKEPLPAEYPLFREGQALFTYLHLAPNRELTEFLMEREVTALGYETLRQEGALPLLAPMSEIAGRMAPIMGAYFLQKAKGGRGVLPTGAAGVLPAKAVILGAGVVGTNAARVSLGLGMDTVILNITPDRLQKIDELFQGRVKTLPLLAHHIREEIAEADMVIGAVLVPGGKTPILITKEMLRDMKKGAVILDVSVDQGGCVETIRPTTHDDPVYEVDGIIHYAVANMPGAYPRTSTLSLTNATLPYILELAQKGIDKAIRESEPLQTALNIYRGKVVLPPLLESMGLPLQRISDIM